MFRHIKKIFLKKLDNSKTFRIFAVYLLKEIKR